MQEVYYVYRSRKDGKFKHVPDWGNRMSDVEVDVSISHQEDAPLGSIKWHKVIVNPLAPTQEKAEKAPQESKTNRAKPARICGISEIAGRKFSRPQRKVNVKNNTQKQANYFYDKKSMGNHRRSALRSLAIRNLCIDGKAPSNPLVLAWNGLVKPSEIMA